MFLSSLCERPKNKNGLNAAAVNENKMEKNSLMECALW